MIERTPVITGLMILCILIGGVAGCAPQSTQVTAPPTVEPTQAATEAPTEAVPSAPAEATLPSGWETYRNEGQCAYAISHPADMEGASQGPYNWSLNYPGTEPNGPFPNFVYVSVIPADFQGGAGEIYNYDPAAAQTLLGLQVGESKSVHPVADMAPSFTYTRLADTALGGQAAQTYENTQPWEFPPGTKEIRYYLQAQSCTYLIGGYMDAAGSGQPGAIDEELFDQVVATFRLAP